MRKHHLTELIRIGRRSELLQRMFKRLSFQLPLCFKSIPVRIHKHTLKIIPPEAAYLRLVCGRTGIQNDLDYLLYHFTVFMNYSSVEICEKSFYHYLPPFYNMAKRSLISFILYPTSSGLCASEDVMISTLCFLSILISSSSMPVTVVSGHLLCAPLF